MIRRKLKMSVALFIFGLAGCTTVTPILGPDGTENQLISCAPVEKCYAKANEICRGPYKIVNTSTETEGANGSTGTIVKLLVKCGL